MIKTFTSCCNLIGQSYDSCGWTWDRNSHM